MNDSRYLSALDWKAAGFSALAAWLIFYATLAPTVTLEYSGQLVVAADHLGVARPPGYPVWTLLAKGFICLFPSTEFQGYPNPARAVHFMSAVFGALSAGLLALLACRLARETDPAPSRPDSWLCASAGISAALLFAVSPAMWSQSVIAETHSLTVFYFLLLLALSLRWMARRDAASPFLLAFLSGLGLSISPLLILFLPVLLAAAAKVSVQAFIRMAAAALLFVAFLLAEFTWGPPRPGIANGVLAAAMLALTVLLALLGILFRRSRSTGLFLLLLLAGLLPYLYLPLAAARHPPMNMGHADSWEGFWHVVRRGQYEALVFVNPFQDPRAFSLQLAAYVRLAASQFTAPVAALALLPAFSLPRLPRPARSSVHLLLLAFFCFAVVVGAGANLPLDVQNTWLGRVLFIPSFALLALLAGIGLSLLLRVILRPRQSRPNPSSEP